MIKKINVLLLVAVFAVSATACEQLGLKEPDVFLVTSSAPSISSQSTSAEAADQASSLASSFAIMSSSGFSSSSF